MAEPYTPEIPEVNTRRRIYLRNIIPGKTQLNIRTPNGALRKCLVNAVNKLSDRTNIFVSTRQDSFGNKVEAPEEPIFEKGYRASTDTGGRLIALEPIPGTEHKIDYSADPKSKWYEHDTTLSKGGL